MKCKVCGYEFEVKKERHYVARSEDSVGVSALAGKEVKLYDAFDCPMCGCQSIVQERKRAVEKQEETENEETTA